MKKPRRRAPKGIYTDQVEGGAPQAAVRGHGTRRRRATAVVAGSLRCFRCGALGASQAHPLTGGLSMNFCDPCRPDDWSLEQLRRNGGVPTPSIVLRSRGKLRP